MTDHKHVHRHMPEAVRFSLAEVRREWQEIPGFNARFALLITRFVGSMRCAYLFAIIALISAPAAFSSGKIIIIVAWVAQTFLQLVLLSVIMVGQEVQAKASDSRAEKTFNDTEAILDRLDTDTKGGLEEVLTAVNQVLSAVGTPRTEK